MDVGSGKTTKKFTTRFILEKGTNSGAAVMIFTPLGNTSVSDILNRSIHVVLTSKYVRLQMCDNGEVYSFPVHNFGTPLAMDGSTVHEMSIEVVGNDIKMTVNGTTYTETWTTGTWTGHALPVTDFFGRYSIFEFYCDGNRNVMSMPEFTYVKLEDNLGFIREDNFNRPDGILTIMPDGTPYNLFAN